MRKTLALLCAFMPILSMAQVPSKDMTKPESTEVWEPEPRIVTAGVVPSDAIVLFNGTNLNEWEQVRDASACKWKLENGLMTVVPSTGNIRTKRKFGDVQLHIEWRSPSESADRKGQGRGNSGVFFQERYEVQILNSYNNRTYSNGQAASIYKQASPLVNATSKEGEWNTYDIIYTAPRFRENGSLEKAATLTVLHNGVVVQNAVKLQGTTEYIGAPKNDAHGKGSIELQDHGNLVSFRNIWIREL